MMIYAEGESDWTNGSWLTLDVPETLLNVMILPLRARIDTSELQLQDFTGTGQGLGRASVPGSALSRWVPYREWKGTKSLQSTVTILTRRAIDYNEQVPRFSRREYSSHRPTTKHRHVQLVERKVLVESGPKLQLDYDIIGN